MGLIPVRCPHWQSDSVIQGGKTKAGLQRYKCLNATWPPEAFHRDLISKGRGPAIPDQRVAMARHGRGSRDTARVWKRRATPVRNALRKKSPRSGV
jgi:transposase-like protein